MVMCFSATKGSWIVSLAVFFNDLGFLVVSSVIWTFWAGELMHFYFTIHLRTSQSLLPSPQDSFSSWQTGDVGLQGFLKTTFESFVVHLLYKMEWWWLLEQSHSLGTEATLFSAGVAPDTSVSFVRWWTDCGWVLSYSIFGLCEDISLHWCHWYSVYGTSDVLVVLITHCRAFLSWAMMNHAGLWCFQSGYYLFLLLTWITSNEISSLLGTCF